MRSRSEHSQPLRPLRPLRGWLLLAAVVFVVAFSSAAVRILLQEANRAPEASKAAARIDAIKSGLTIGAGAAGAFALILAARRQWLNERTEMRQELEEQRSATHDSNVSSANEFDSRERRITDLYVKAVEQLGSDKEAVRLGGLYALSRLGQDHEPHRQLCIDMMCAYLRMPISPPLTETQLIDTSQACEQKGELLVRSEAGRIISRHLAHSVTPTDSDNSDYFTSRVPSPQYWPSMVLNLDEATLVDFNLSGSRFTKATLNGASFIGPTNLYEAEATYLSFSRSTFYGPLTVSALGLATPLQATGIVCWDMAALSMEPRTSIGSVFAQFATFKSSVRFGKDASLNMARIARNVSRLSIVLPDGWHLVESDDAEWYGLKHRPEPSTEL